MPSIPKDAMKAGAIVPPPRPGEVVTVDLEAMHGGKPLPLQDPKVNSL